MKHILGSEGSQALSRLASGPALLAFDYDGTLAPISRRRDRVRLRERTQRLFGQVCRSFPCAVISGRARDDVASRLGDAEVRFVMGNHGIEPSPGMRRFEQAAQRARAELTRALGSLPGFELEDKRYTLALHYRRARNKRVLRQAIDDAVAKLPVEMRVTAGKDVVNLMPAGAPNKGDALVALREAVRAEIALFVGDDDTDEDVFRLGQPRRLISVRVGPSRASAAAWYLRSQREIDLLLRRLVEVGAGPRAETVASPQPRE